MSKTLNPINTSFFNDVVHTGFEHIKLEELSPLTPLADELDSLESFPTSYFWHWHADNRFLLQGETNQDLEGPKHIDNGASTH